MSEIIYILTNPAIPDLVKIGRTDRDLKTRVGEISRAEGVPVPFEVYCAGTVENDSKEVEKRLHHVFGDQRVNPKKEFFKINPERALWALKLAGLKDIAPSDSYIDDPVEQQSFDKAKRRANFTFSSVDIPKGSTIYFIDDEDITATVVDDRKVNFRGQDTYLSPPTVELLKEYRDWNYSGARGPDYWMFENESLTERRLRLEEYYV